MAVAGYAQCVMGKGGITTPIVETLIIVLHVEEVGVVEFVEERGPYKMLFPIKNALSSGSAFFILYLKCNLTLRYLRCGWGQR